MESDVVTYEEKRMRKKITFLAIILGSISLFILFWIDNGIIYVQNESVDKRQFLLNLIFESSLITMLTVISVVFILWARFSMVPETDQKAKIYVPLMSFSFSISNFELCEVLYATVFPNFSLRFFEQFQAIFYCIFFIFFFKAAHYTKKELFSGRIANMLLIIYSMLIVLVFPIPAEYFYYLQIFGLSITMLFLVVLFWTSVVRVVSKENQKESFVECIVVMLILYFINVYNANLLLNLIGQLMSMKIAFMSAFFFLLFWLILIAYRVNLSGVALKETEEELQVTNDELEVHRNQLLAAYEIMEMEIEEQTKDLQKTNEQLEKEIVQRKKNEREIERLAYYDQLTNIPNRRYFKEFMEEKTQNKSHVKSFSLLYMDLDGFKGVNDNYGHAAGDQLLKMVAKDIKRGIRTNDFVARLGGDEFAAIILNLHDKKRIEDICEGIYSRVTKKKEIEGNEVSVGISIGVAFYPSDASTIENLIIKADASMYYAKNDKEIYRMFSEEIL